MVYDGNSRMIQMIDDRGATTDYTFDTLDRQTTMVYADGSTENFAYNNASNLITFTDCNGSIFTNTWDCLGRKTAVAIAPASGLGGTTSQSFQYDGLGRQTLSSDTTPTGTVQVAKVYDSLSRTLEEAPNTQGLARYLTNTAFTSYPPTQFTYPNGRQVNWTYDRRQSCGDSATPSIASWRYFGPNRVAEVSLGGGTVIQTMLNNARTHSAVQSSVPNPGWGIQSSDRLGYDGAGRMITKRYLTGGINGSTYAYNNTSALVGQTTAYDHGGNKFYERSLQAVDRSNLYQPVDNSGNIASPTPGYDSVGRLLQYQRGELNSSGGYQNSGGGSVVAAEEIDVINTDRTRTYNLDGLGNWRNTSYQTVIGYGTTSSTVEARNHNYRNQLTLITATTDGTAEAIPFGYDHGNNANPPPYPAQKGNGCITNDGDLVFQYDAFNRLVSCSRVVDGKTIGEYSYDATNRRVRKTVTNGGLSGNIPNGTTDSCWFGWQTMEERNPYGGSGGTDTPIKQYVWGSYIDECLQLNLLAVAGPQQLAVGVYYPLQDTLYRTMALANSSGGVVEAYDTDPYGNTIIFTGPGPDNTWFTDDDAQATYGANSTIFCGYLYDPESLNYYVRNRFYAPHLGRWLTVDPIGYRAGKNLYEYCGGRPVTAIDPSGNWGWGWVGLGAAIVGVVAVGVAVALLGPEVAVAGAVLVAADAAETAADAIATETAARAAAAAVVGAGTVYLATRMGAGSGGNSERWRESCDSGDPCDFYLAWCKWGARNGHRPDDSPGRYWLLDAASCEACYDYCIETGRWPLEDCRLASGTVLPPGEPPKVWPPVD
jgi:RHS repeat-associated protein